MPRDGFGIYSKSAGTTAVSGTTIDSAKYNATIDDLVSDANAARPITAGGTGATDIQGAIDNLFAGGTTVDDDALLIVDPADATKRVRLDAGNVTAGQTRILTMPDQNVTITAAGAALIDDNTAQGQRNTINVPSNIGFQAPTGITVTTTSTSWVLLHQFANITPVMGASSKLRIHWQGLLIATAAAIGGVNASIGLQYFNSSGVWTDLDIANNVNYIGAAAGAYWQYQNKTITIDETYKTSGGQWGLRAVFRSNNANTTAQAANPVIHYMEYV